MFISPIKINGIFLCDFNMFVIKISKSSINLTILPLSDLYIASIPMFTLLLFIMFRMQFAFSMLYSELICSISFLIKTTTPSLLRVLLLVDIVC